MSADNAGHTWDWADDADDIVVKAQPAVAVYPGPAGIVIRLQGDFNDDADGVVWFGVDQALAVAKAILKAAGLDAADIADLAPEPAPCAIKPKDATGAERQRRRRARQKGLDADRDTVTETVTRDGRAST